MASFQHCGYAAAAHLIPSERSGMSPSCKISTSYMLDKAGSAVALLCYRHTFGNSLTHKLTLPFDDLAKHSISYTPYETADFVCAGAFSAAKPRPNGLSSEQLPLESV